MAMSMLPMSNFVPKNLTRYVKKTDVEKIKDCIDLYLKVSVSV